MEFRLLGPLQVLVAAREVHLGGARSQRIVAALALSPNRVVTVDRLTAAAWEQAPPMTARRQVQNRIAALRTVLMPLGGAIETHDAGYLLRAAPNDVDSVVFSRLVADARRASDPNQAAKLLRTALALWRGPALAGLGGALLECSAASLEEQRLAVLGDCLDLELRAGHDSRLVPELRQLVTDHPLQERFTGQWMLALFRAGRQGDALDAYQRLRRRLVDELGVEPGPPLQELHHAILTGNATRRQPDDDSVDASAVTLRAPVPRQLPHDVVGFTGRVRELDRVVAALSHAGPKRVPIVAVQGVGGVGKSTLAIHAAHRVVELFPDGQLYVNLHGATAGLRPLSVLDVLGRFLRALGVDGAHVPTELEEAAARFRSEVADRRVLIVLDNALDTAQVAPLLPGSVGAPVVVTSRRPLSGLDGALRIRLDVLTPVEAMAQLAGIVGSHLVGADRAAAAEMVQWCGRLPLAIKIAGARLVARPGWSLRTMSERLAVAQRRLDELELTDASIRANLVVSRDQLRQSDDPTDRAAAVAFLALGSLDGPDVGLPVAARLLDRAEPDAERVLERLVDASLLESPTPGRYRMHDLLRLSAREQDRERVRGETTALTRAIGHYVGVAWQAYRLLRPGDDRPDSADPRWSNGGGLLHDAAAALQWMELERANLVAAVRQAADTPVVPPGLAIQLAQAQYAFFRLRGYWSEAVEVNLIAYAVADRIGDLAAVATACNDLGAGLCQQGRYSDAIDYLTRGIALHSQLDDQLGRAQSMTVLGVVRDTMGQYDAALAWYEESLAIHEQLGNRRGQAMNLGNLGPIYRRQGRFSHALACHKRGLSIFAELGDRYGRSVSLRSLGTLYAHMGLPDEALASLRESLQICHEMGDRFGEAETLQELGVVHRSRRRHDAALAYHGKALAICRELGRRDGEASALRELGHTLRAVGSLKQARDCWQEALTILEELRSGEAVRARAMVAGATEPGRPEPKTPPTTDRPTRACGDQSGAPPRPISLPSGSR